jgi:HK97 family phage major capsid protein
MKKSSELREQKLLVVEQMKKIHETAEKEDRSFNEAEESKYNDLKTQVVEFDKRIKVAEEREFQELEIAQSKAKTISEREKRELKRYSLMSAVRGALGGKLEGLEKEMHEEAVREANQAGTAISGIGVPSLIIYGQRTDQPQDVSTDTYGQELVPTMKPRIIDGLFDPTVFETLGATMMRNLTGTLKLPRNTAALSAAWEGENDDAANTASTWDEVTFSPNRLAAFTQISKTLLHQSSVDIEGWVKREIARAVRLKLEESIINGTTPVDGLLGLANTTSVAMGTLGGNPTYAKLLEFEAGLGNNKALEGNLGWVTNSKVRGILKSISKDSGSGKFLWEDGNTLLGYPVGITSLMPSNLSKSTSGNILSGAIFGNWANYGIAQWGGYDIIADQYTKAKNALVEIVINTYFDAKPMVPGAFAQSMDIKTT